ncbi:endonuclease domain-containing protein [Algoriphagus marincola]|uniref:Endonuclease domain-containing protein n=1 Tax=Algoriphagus marincola TaxID=264027 RepID=A0ABS7N3G6_9BACT|nr:endonuclease domain-containing protein [Algoriphagus marincola]MBY5950861.1 endonuclease domain-containing protein [Algoriphagus marincola]
MSYSENLFYGASPEIHKRARELRKQMTPAEKVLWNFLKNKSLEGFKFRRQHPIDKYIVDFYCHQKKLVIEVDGSIHDQLDQKEYDSGRTSVLEEFGLKVIRFRNEEVLDNFQSVIGRISKGLTSP